MSQTIRIKRRAVSTVPDDILTNANLLPLARVVLGWMLGRSPDFELHVWHIRKTFKLSEERWVRIRKNLAQHGYFFQTREHDGDGKWRWVHVITDSPTCPPSPQKSGDGQPSPQEPWDGQPCDGAPSHGGPRDKPGVSNTNTPPPLPPAQPGANLESAPVDAGGLSPEQEQDIADELAGRQAAAERGEAPKIGNVNAWVKKLRARVAAGENILTQHGARVRAARDASAAVETRRVASASVPLGDPPPYAAEALEVGTAAAALNHIHAILPRSKPKLKGASRESK